jgi:hypothetical protein
VVGIYLIYIIQLLKTITSYYSELFFFIVLFVFDNNIIIILFFSVYYLYILYSLLFLDFFSEPICQRELYPAHVNEMKLKYILVDNLFVFFIYYSLCTRLLMVGVCIHIKFF